MSQKNQEPVSFSDHYLPMDSVAILPGEIVCTNADGYVVPGAEATLGLIAWGVANEGVNNTAGDPGDKSVAIGMGWDDIGIRTWPLTNAGEGDAVVQADVGKDCWIAGPNTVAGNSASGTRSRAGKVLGFWKDGRVMVHFDMAPFEVADLQAQLDDIQPLVDAGITASKKTLTLAFDNAALVATSGSANGTAATVNIDTALPANSRIVGVDMRAYTPFTGGSVSAVTCDVGTAGDIDALVDGADLQTAAVDGGPSTMPSGIRRNKTFAAGGQLTATITPDGGHKLSALTAGSVIIDVLYIVLA